jgi:hypothetical protein
MDSTIEQSSDTMPTQQVKLTEIPIKDENTALNILIAFIDVAQKRGAYAVDESAKIWECIQRFINPPVAQSSTDPAPAPAPAPVPVLSSTVLPAREPEMLPD